jgi:probable DNA repair protein
MAVEFSRAIDEAVIVVPDGRAAHQWEAHLGGAREDPAAAAWVSPAVVPYRVWTASLWSQSDDSARPLLLSIPQSLALWRSTITASREGAELIGVDGAAQWAADAADLLQHWQLDPGELQATAEQADFRAFLSWFREYRERLHAHQWTDHSAVAAHLSAAALAAPRALLLADLRELGPADEALVSRLAQAGCRVERWPSATSAPNAQRIQLADAGVELRAAAEWAHERLVRNPAARLAVVIPDLTRRAAEVERVVAAAVAPHALWHRATTLADHSLIGAALNAVELLTPRATFATLSRWLRSPFFASAADERAARAVLERRLRTTLTAQLPFVAAYRSAGVAARIRHERASVADALDRALAATGDVLSATPSRWAELWQRGLTALGWPPADTLVDEPAIAAWRAALDELATLAPVLGSVSAQRALTELERSLHIGRIARPMPLAGVHALAHIDEVGPGYDAAWVAGFTDTYWPQAARANPLLPRGLQRAHAMPWSSPQDARERSARSLRELFGRVPELVFSTPARVYDYPAEPSPAIRNLPTLSADLFGAAAPRSAVQPARETISEAAPALAGAVLLGGASALNRQARCPLRAFCEYRLGARALEPVRVGMPARLQGIVAHRALELLYAGVASSADLARLVNEPAEVDRCVEHALRETFGAAYQPLRAVYDLEHERLTRDLGELLHSDAQRTAFRVAAVEEQRNIELGGRSLRIRIDRLDTLADGSTAVIDYKTGDATIADWFKDRLRDTQVPIYAVQAAEHVSAAVLARLGAATTGYVGVWRTSGAFPGNSRKLPLGRNWPEQLAEWRRQIETLIEEYARGDLRLFTVEPDLDEARGSYAPLTRVLEQAALHRGSLRPW